MQPPSSAGPWIDSLPQAAADPLARDERASVVIVGGGIAGASAAWHLASAGEDVVVLEAGRLLGGASGRNAGFLLADGAESYAAVRRQRGPGIAEALRTLGRRTRAFVRDLAQRHPIAFERCGSLRLAEDDGEARDLEASARLLDEGLRYFPDGRVPAPWGDLGYCGAVQDSGDGVFDPVALGRAVIAEARDHGARFHEQSPVLGVEAESGGVRVRTARAAVRARHAVLATNAWTNALLPGRSVIQPVRAQMLCARIDPPVYWMQPVYARRGADYWRALPDGRVLVGGMRRAGGSEEATDAARPSTAVQAALDGLLEALAGQDARTEVLDRWAGIMGFTADALPVAGAAPRLPGVWVLAGFNGHGMGWAPGLAQDLARDIVGGGPGSIPRSFLPARFERAT